MFSRRTFSVLLRVFVSSCFTLFAIGFVPAARADAPSAAGAAVRRFMEAIRAQDRAAILDAVADDYDYNGLRKKDLDPLGPFAVLTDHLLYRTIQLLEVHPGVGTALVDLTFTGRLNLVAYNRGEPTVVGTERAWIEVRRQPDSQWRVSAVRPVHLHYTHPGSPSTFVTGVTVNGLTSVATKPGAALAVAGQTEFGLVQSITLGAVFLSLNLHLDKNSESYEPWSMTVSAPAAPGRYFLDTVSFFYGQVPNGTLYLAWDEVTVPVVAK
jgi:hypothetical protein